MIFCGQCGLQLAPGIKNCPRCGALVDTPAENVGELHADDPTIASPSFITRNPSQPHLSEDQQRLVLRPEQEGGTYGTQGAYSPTSRVEAQQPPYVTHAPTTPSTTGLPNQGFATPTSNFYPPQNTYQGYTPSGSSYPGLGQQGNAYQSYQQGAADDTRNARGRTVGLTLILIGVLLILAAIILFALTKGM